MIQNNYKLDDTNYTTISNSSLDFTYNWEWVGRHENFVASDTEAGTSDNYSTPATEIDDFLYFSCGYSQGFSIARADQSTELINVLYKSANRSSNSIAVDKVRKKAYEGGYNFSIIYEHDYSNIYYSGGTTPTTINLTDADGFQGEYIGYGAKGNSMVVAGDYLYYSLGNAYPTSGEIQRWDLSTRAAGSGVPVYNRNNASSYRGSLIYDEANDRIFIYNGAGSTSNGVILILSASTSGATGYNIPHSSLNLLPSYYSIGSLWDEDNINQLYIGYQYSIWNKVDITPCLASTDVTDYIRPIVLDLPSQNGVNSQLVFGPDYSQYFTRGSYYIGRWHIQMTSGRTQCMQTYTHTYNTGFDRENLQRFGCLTSSIGRVTTEDKKSKSILLLTDIVRNGHQSTHGASGILKDIHPSTDTGTGYTYDSGTTWSMGNYYNSYSRLFTTGTDDMFWFETGSTLTFEEDGMCVYNRISDNVVVNGDFISGSASWNLYDVFVEDGKLQKTGTTLAGYARQDGFIKQNTLYEVNIKFKSTRFNDGKRLNVGLGDNGTDIIFYGSSTQTRYITSAASNNSLYLYFQDGIQGEIDFIEVYEVEKAVITECFINNIQDHVFYPSSAATLTVSVSSNGGVNWEEYDYTTDKNHVFTDSGTDFHIKFEGNGDRVSGPGYIQNTKKLNVDLFSSSDRKLLRSNGKIIRANGKLIRI